MFVGSAPQITLFCQDLIFRGDRLHKREAFEFGALAFDQKDPLTHYALALSYMKQADTEGDIGLLITARKHFAQMLSLNADLDESIRFYSETLGMPLKFRDGSHFAALDGGSVTLALATSIDHPMPGKVVPGIKTDDVDAAAAAQAGRGAA